MIGFLRGEPLTIAEGQLILNVHGVGYELSITPALMAQAQAGAAIDVWVYTQVRDDAIQLYGFSSPREKSVFLELIKVNGVGPKSALHILAASSHDQVVELIETGNAQALAKLPKVGKKTAEQIILTLKGKLVSADQQGSLQRSGFQAREEIISALGHLGFRLADIEKVVDTMSPATSLEQGVRDGLRALTN